MTGPAVNVIVVMALEAAEPVSVAALVQEAQ